MTITNHGRTEYFHPPTVAMGIVNLTSICPHESPAICRPIPMIHKKGNNEFTTIVIGMGKKDFVLTIFGEAPSQAAKPPFLDTF